MTNTIHCETLEQFVACLQELLARGLSFEAYTRTLTIELELGL
jgi:hypothetical protein